MDEDLQRSTDARGDRLSFAGLLRRHRRALGLTQEELANRAGLSARAISDLERGLKRTPRRVTVDLLVDALGLSERESEELRRSVGSRARSAADPPLARSNLPARLTSFVGRQRDRAEVRSRLLGDEVRLLTLAGAAGAGKTRLALEVAEDAKERFAEGACFVGLAAVADPSEVRPAIASSVADRDGVSCPLKGDLGRYLRPKRMLLVLDNFEHVAEAAPEVCELLRECPGLKALVTSRAALRLSAEHTYKVEPLPVPEEDAGRIVRHTLCSSDAVELFVQRARAASHGFELTEENAPAVAKICRQLDGLPLAIELAAARIRLLTPEEMLGWLEKPLDLLRGGKDLSERHRSLRDTLEWSHELLGEREKELFARLSVFVGGCDLDAAGAVCGDDEEGTGSVFEGLSVLVDGNLVKSRKDPPEQTRFGMLETIREYASEKLDEGGETERVRQRHASYYLRLAERAVPELAGSDQSRWFKRLEVEHANFRAALEWARVRRDNELGLRLAGALWRSWDTHGHLEEGLRWLKTFLKMEGDVSAHLRAEALNGAGGLARLRGRYEEAGRFLRECLRIREASGDTVGAARAYNNLGVVEKERGDYESAEGFYEQSIALTKEVGDERLLVVLMNSLGVAKLYKGDLIDARRLLGESWRRGRRLGMAREVACILCNLGEVALYRGDHGEALGLLEESLELAQESENVACAMGAMRGLGLTMLDSGGTDEAVGFLRRALRGAYRSGDAKETIEGLQALGCAACEMDQRPRTVALWAAVERARSELGVVEHPVERAFYEKWRSRMPAGEYPVTRTAREVMTLEEAVAYALEDGPPQE